MQTPWPIHNDKVESKTQGIYLNLDLLQNGGPAANAGLNMPNLTAK